MSSLPKFHLSPAHWRISRMALVACLIVAGVYLGGSAALYRVSEHEALQQRAREALAGTRRNVQFDAHIERSLFPRPTIILHNVVLSEADGKAPALRAQEVKIGIGWSSLISEPTIEKLVLNDVHALLIRNNQGRWNIADLWQTRNQRPAVFNRVQINRGTLIVRDAEQGEFAFSQISLALARQNDTTIGYQLEAQAQSPYWENLQLAAAGDTISSPNNQQFPKLAVKFNGKENGYTFSGSLKTNATWREQDFIAENSKLEIASYRHNSTFNISITKLASRYGDTKLTGINAVFTAPGHPNQPTGTLAAAQAQWQDNELHSDEINLDLNTRNAQQDKLDINAKSELIWRNGSGIQLGKLKFISTQTTPQGTPRFASEMEGSLKFAHLANWQIQLQGLFDKQPANIALNRNENHIIGSLKIAKLNTKNYAALIKSNPTTSDISQIFPAAPLTYQIDADIGTLETPRAQIDNIHASINASAESIIIAPLTADLYSGRTDGSLIIQNRTPIAYQLHQKAEGVQIHPMLQDLFQQSRISGKGTAEFALTAQGSSPDEMLASLNGSVKLDINDGEWSGISFNRIRNLLAGIGNSTPEAEATAMPFSHFVLEANIQNGISSHSAQAAFTWPAATMTSSGKLNLASNEITEDIRFKGNAESQALPIRVSGKMDNPSVSLNFQQITSGSTTAEEKQKAISSALKQQWQWFIAQPDTQPENDNSAPAPAQAAPKPKPVARPAAPAVAPAPEKPESRNEAKHEPRIALPKAKPVKPAVKPVAKPAVKSTAKLAAQPVRQPEKAKPSNKQPEKAKPQAGDKSAAKPNSKPPAKAKDKKK